MSNTIFRPFLEKLGGTKVSDFIGKEGDLFYDPATTTLRISDGSTPGGIVFSSGGGGTTFDQDLNTTANVIFNRVDITLGKINVATGNSFDVYVTPDGTTIHNLKLGTDGNLTAPGNITVDGSLKANVGIQEKLGLFSGIGAGVYDLDCSSQGQISYNFSVSSNWTINLVNLNLESMHATTITIVIEQDVTGYYPDGIQIAGVSETINWKGNTLPTPSSSRTDIVTFRIFRHETGFGTGYSVFGELTGY